jgi:NAD(P)H-dependent flavin oxidoreductase YrpB (nitropropane dioxygenase family)
VARAHEAGAVWARQVGDVRAAEVALDAGVDVLVAQSWEAGGNSGYVATMVLVLVKVSHSDRVLPPFMLNFRPGHRRRSGHCARC